MKIQCGDVFISGEDGNGIVSHINGELSVIFPDTWYPVSHFIDDSKSYNVIKVVRPVSNKDASHALFKNDYSGLAVVWSNFHQLRLSEGMCFVKDSGEKIFVYQVASGVYKLFNEGSFNRKSDIEYSDSTTVKDINEKVFEGKLKSVWKYEKLIGEF